MGPFKFTYKELEKQGVIVDSEVRKVVYFFAFPTFWLGAGVLSQGLHVHDQQRFVWSVSDRGKDGRT